MRLDYEVTFNVILSRRSFRAFFVNIWSCIIILRCLHPQPGPSPSPSGLGLQQAQVEAVEGYWNASQEDHQSVKLMHKDVSSSVEEDNAASPPAVSNTTTGARSWLGCARVVFERYISVFNANLSCSSPPGDASTWGINFHADKCCMGLKFCSFYISLMKLFMLFLSPTATRLCAMLL